MKPRIVWIEPDQRWIDSGKVVIIPTELANALVRYAAFELLHGPRGTLARIGSVREMIDSGVPFYVCPELLAEWKEELIYSPKSVTFKMPIWINPDQYQIEQLNLVAIPKEMANNLVNSQRFYFQSGGRMLGALPNEEALFVCPSHLP